MAYSLERQIITYLNEDGGWEPQPTEAIEAAVICEDPKTFKRALDLLQEFGYIKNVAAAGDSPLWVAMATQ